VAFKGSPLMELRRTTLTCLLNENSFYEKGDTTSARLATLVPQCKPEDVAALAIEARTAMQLRHVPLFLIRELARIDGTGPLVYQALVAVLQRPDEMSEYLSLWHKDGREVESAASKRALAKAFIGFTPYQLGKYQGKDKAIKLRDVMRIVHPKPVTDEQKAVFKQIKDGTLAAPETWEAELSAGGNKREVFERLIAEKKLGGLATLRNLRNMQDAGVPMDVIRERLSAPMPRVWPYRFVVAAKYAPKLEDALEQAMYRAAADVAKLHGRTGLLIDVSGSMDAALTTRVSRTQDDTSRIDVAAGLGILLREKADDVLVATFSDKVVLLPPRRGFALRDAVVKSQVHSGTHLRGALEALYTDRDWRALDRLIVITDEQSADGIRPAWTKFAYVINVASYQYGVGHNSGWHHISGWSERVFDYIQAVEPLQETA